MKTSDSTLKISAAFVRAQGEITSAVKDALNPAFKSKYADLGSVTDAIRPSAAKYGLGYLQEGTMVEGNRLLLTTRIVHESGEWFESEMLMPLTKQDAHGLGSALTYGKRYALSAFFGVSSGEEDDDGNAATGAAAKSSGNYPAKPAYSPAKPAAAPARPTTPATPVQAAKAAPAAVPENLATLLEAGAIAAAGGLPSYQKFWMGIEQQDRNAIGGKQHDVFKAQAQAVKAVAA